FLFNHIHQIIAKTEHFPGTLEESATPYGRSKFHQRDQTIYAKDISLQGNKEKDEVQFMNPTTPRQPTTTTAPSQKPRLSLLLAPLTNGTPHLYN
ncbi:MAG: hypothetical protein Q8877_03210, partial [Sweet potato little leaf phytoplasma]|nr:hypothetical protein [Sweet potato little leaf phytoplasma]